MRRSMRVIFVVMVVIVCLPLSHWYAYHKGKVDQLLGQTELASGELRQAVEMLKLRESAPEEYAERCDKWWRVRLDASYITLQAFLLPQARRSGDQKVIAELERLTAEVDHFQK